MAILIKDMEMPESCDGCKLKSCGYCDITNRLIPYDGSRHGDCPLVEAPDEQPDRNAQERYEDLCEYFKDCTDKGMGILGDRKEFKAWLERLHWHVVRCDELGRELEKLQSAQQEQQWIPVTDHLPDEDVPVLVTDDAGGMAAVGIDSCGRYEDTGERFWYTSQNVTAWMYTVEPYGGEQE